MAMWRCIRRATITGDVFNEGTDWDIGVGDDPYLVKRGWVRVNLPLSLSLEVKPAVADARSADLPLKLKLKTAAANARSADVVAATDATAVVANNTADGAWCRQCCHQLPMCKQRCRWCSHDYSDSCGVVAGTSALETALKSLLQRLKLRCCSWNSCRSWSVVAAEVASSEVAASSFALVAVADGCSAGANRMSLRLKAELKSEKPKKLQLSIMNEAMVVAGGTSLMSQSAEEQAMSPVTVSRSLRLWTLTPSAESYGLRASLTSMEMLMMFRCHWCCWQKLQLLKPNAKCRWSWCCRVAGARCGCTQRCRCSCDCSVVEVR
jgi:hypothetical protein